MPYTASFSEQFYEKLGHDVVKELIDLVNHVDLAYRTELSEQNESNFQKFEAVLRGEMAALEARLEKKIVLLGGNIEGLEARLEKKIDGVEARLEMKIEGVETRLDGKMEVGFASLRAEMAAGQATMLRWMVFLFLGAALTVVGLG